MYAGRIVEYADVKTLFRNPKHPYTEGLIGVHSRPGRGQGGLVIPGAVPNLIDLPPGCFAPRCLKRSRTSWKMHGRSRHAGDEAGHPVRCWLYEERPGKRQR